MKTSILAVAIALGTLSPMAADAADFTLTYTLFDLPSVGATLDISAAANPYVAGLYDVTALTGSRGGEAITGFDDFSAFYYPAVVPTGFQFPTYLDGLFAEIYFTAGGVDYTLTRNSSDLTFYHEFTDAGGYLIRADNGFSISPAASAAVPEPASWAMLVAGFGIVGGAIRVQRRRVTFA